MCIRICVAQQFQTKKKTFPIATLIRWNLYLQHVTKWNQNQSFTNVVRRLCVSCSCSVKTSDNSWWFSHFTYYGLFSGLCMKNDLSAWPTKHLKHTFFNGSCGIFRFHLHPFIFQVFNIHIHTSETDWIYCVCNRWDLIIKLSNYDEC